MAQRKRGRDVGAQSEADRTENGSEKEAQRREKITTQSDNGEGTTGKNSVGSGTKQEAEMGSGNVCGCVTEKRKRL